MSDGTAGLSLAGTRLGKLSPGLAKGSASNGVTWVGVSTLPLWVSMNRLGWEPSAKPFSGDAATASYRSVVRVWSSQSASQMTLSSGGRAPLVMVPLRKSPSR
jgi:hypothetical protein